MVRDGAREFMPHVPFCEKTTRTRFRESITTAHPTTFVCVKRRSGRLTGFLVCSMHEYLFSPRLHVILDTIYVRPDSRGTRAAASLAEQFVEWAKRLGALEAYMGVGHGQHIERTARFFERLGAQRVGWSMRIKVPEHAWRR